MKILLSAVLAVIIMTGTANAQKVSFGIKGGVNIYNADSRNGYDYNPVVGLHAGVLSHIHLTKHFALQPEIVFSTHGAHTRNNVYETRDRFAYINVPVLVQYMFNNGIRVQAGPQLGFLVHAVSKYANVKENIREDLNAVDFGFATGASYQIPNTGFGFDARFNLGLSDINRNSTVRSTNRGLQLGVFYIFPKK